MIKPKTRTVEFVDYSDLMLPFYCSEHVLCSDLMFGNVEHSLVSADTLSQILMEYVTEAQFAQPVFTDGIKLLDDLAERGIFISMES